MTAAVFGMIAGDHDRADARALCARATASFASSRGGSIMPIRPRKTRSCSTCSSTVVALEARLPAATRKATPSVRSASPASSSFDLRISARRSAVRRPRLFAHEFLRAAREQHVRRAFGEDEQALLPLGVAYEPCSSACARRRRALRRRARSGRRALRPPARLCAPRRSARLRSGRPAPSSARRAPAARRCWRGRRRSARARNSIRSAPSSAPPPSRAHVSLGRVAGALEIHAPARGDDGAHRHLVFGQRAGLVGGDDVRRAERFDRREMAHDGVPLRHALHAQRRAPPSRPPAGPRHRRDRERHAEDEHVEERREAAHVLDEDDRGDHHDGDDDDDDRRAACRRGRAPSAAAWSRPGLRFSIPAMRPISVCIPVAVTTAVPRP